uniref:C-type lectin domain-containing protein n=1 Tax=Syphacia muris TaxID=451379 RepID=A0A0N5AG74_9BILA
MGLPYWLGMQQIAFRKWIWDDTKETVKAYNRWSIDLPATSKQCVYANFNGRWGASDCEERNIYRGFVCKKNYTALCEQGWTNLWSSCYIYHSEFVKRNIAKLNCIRYHKAPLTSVLSSEEEQFLSDFTGNNGFWTDLMYINSHWMWNNYEYAKYSNWSYSDDIMDAVGSTQSYMFVRNGWISADGSTEKVGYVCKKPGYSLLIVLIRSLLQLFESRGEDTGETKRVILFICITITAIASYCGITAAWKISSVIKKRRKQKLSEFYTSVKRQQHQDPGNCKRVSRQFYRLTYQKRSSTNKRPKSTPVLNQRDSSLQQAFSLNIESTSQNPLLGSKENLEKTTFTKFPSSVFETNSKTKTMTFKEILAKFSASEADILVDVEKSSSKLNLPTSPAQSPQHLLTFLSQQPSLSAPTTRGNSLTTVSKPDLHHCPSTQSVVLLPSASCYNPPDNRSIFRKKKPPDLVIPASIKNI